MRQSPVLNHENKQTIDEILRMLNSDNTISKHSLPYLGALLYIKKKLDETRLSDGTSDGVTEFQNFMRSNPLDGLIRKIILTVSKLPKSEKTGSILDIILFSEFNEEEYLHWFDYAIENTYRYKNLTGQFVVSRGLTELAQAFICGNAKKTFIPFGGIMNFATDIDSFEYIEATEADLITWEIGMLRLALCGRLENINFSNKDVTDWTNEKFDTIISMPLFGQKIQMGKQPSYFNVRQPEESDLIAPIRFLENSSDDAVCIVYAPASILWAGSNKKNFRKWATQNHIVDTVILLPKNMLNVTNIQLACVILRRKPFRENAVRVIDASGLYTNHLNVNHLNLTELMNSYHKDTDNVSKSVSLDEIESLDYSWNIPEYLKTNEIECPEGYTVSVLEDVVSLPRLDESTSRDKGKIVRLSDLSDDWTHPYIDQSNLVDEKNLYGFSRLNKRAILLSSIRSLKPSIVEATEDNPVWLNKNIMAIIPDDTIDMEYLCMTLSKLEVPTIGMDFLSRTFVLRHKIAYPEIAIQKSLYKEACRAFMLSKANELGLQEIIEQMKSEYINEVRIRKHDMKTPMAQMRNTLPLLEDLSDNLSKEHSALLSKYIQRLKKSLDVLSGIVSHIADENVFSTPEIMNLEEHLKGYVTMNDRYFIEYHRDEASLKEAGIDIPYVKMGKLDLSRLVQNIVDNAINHGFVRDDKEYSLHITLAVEDTFFVVNFSNDGEPLPDGMEKVRFGIKGIKGIDSDGSGTGGYIVKSITHHYGGDYDLFSFKLADIDFTNVIVKLPIYRKEYE